MWNEFVILCVCYSEVYMKFIVYFVIIVSLGGFMYVFMNSMIFLWWVFWNVLIWNLKVFSCFFVGFLILIILIVILLC